MAARDKLTPKKQSSPGQANASIPLRVQPPNISMKMPEIKIPDIKSDVNIDMKPIADAFTEAMRIFHEHAMHQQAAIMQILDVLSQKDVNVQVEAPKVSVSTPKRPGSYYVEFEREDGETVGMRISADRSH